LGVSCSLARSTANQQNFISGFDVGQSIDGRSALERRGCPAAQRVRACLNGVPLTARRELGALRAPVHAVEILSLHGEAEGSDRPCKEFHGRPVPLAADSPGRDKPAEIFEGSCCLCGLRMINH